MVLTVHGLADGFGIGRIVLVAFYVRFDIAGRHQAHIMPATGDLSRPALLYLDGGLPGSETRQ